MYKATLKCTHTHIIKSFLKLLFYFVCLTSPLSSCSSDTQHTKACGIQSVQSTTNCRPGGNWDTNYKVRVFWYEDAKHSNQIVYSWPAWSPAERCGIKSRFLSLRESCGRLPRFFVSGMWHGLSWRDIRMLTIMQGRWSTLALWDLAYITGKFWGSSLEEERPLSPSEPLNWAWSG